MLEALQTYHDPLEAISNYELARRMSKLMKSPDDFEPYKQWLARLGRGKTNRTYLETICLAAVAVWFPYITNVEESPFDVKVVLGNEKLRSTVTELLVKLHAVIIGNLPALKYLYSDFIPAIVMGRYNSIDPVKLEFIETYDLAIDFAQILGHRLKYDTKKLESTEFSVILADHYWRNP